MHRRASSYSEIKQKMVLLIFAFVLKGECVYIKSTMGSCYKCSKSVTGSCGDRAPSFPISSSWTDPRSVLAVSFRVLMGNKAEQPVRHLIISLLLNMILQDTAWVKNIILRSYCWLQLDPENFLCRVMTSARVFAWYHDFVQIGQCTASQFTVLCPSIRSSWPFSRLKAILISN
jgi:hypothetical protein